MASYDKAPSDKSNDQVVCEEPVSEAVLQKIITRQKDSYFKNVQELQKMNKEKLAYIKTWMTNIFWESVLKICIHVIEGQIRKKMPVGICITYPGSTVINLDIDRDPTWPRINESVWQKMAHEQELFVSTGLKAYIKHQHFESSGNFGLPKNGNIRFIKFPSRGCPICMETSDSISDNIYLYNIMLVNDEADDEDVSFVFNTTQCFKYQCIQDISRAAADPKEGSSLYAQTEIYC